MKSFLQFIIEGPDGSSRTVQLKKGLERKQAYSAATKKAGSDFRGMKYNKETGKAILV